MSNKPNPGAGSGRPAIYQIRVKGHLDRRRSDWFEGMTITLEKGGETLLTGPVEDQTALYGLLKKVRDLGVPLISVTRVKPGEAGGSDVKPQIEPSYLERVKQDQFNEPCQCRSKEGDKR